MYAKGKSKQKHGYDKDSLPDFGMDVYMVGQHFSCLSHSNVIAIPFYISLLDGAMVLSDASETNGFTRTSR